VIAFDHFINIPDFLVAQLLRTHSEIVPSGQVAMSVR
jgi:hypothetical protein